MKGRFARRRTYGFAALAFASASVVGCARLPSGPPYDDPGWKLAHVARIVSGNDLDDIKKDECVTAMAPQRVSRSEFAIVWYPKGRGAIRRTVLIPEGLHLAGGDHVRVNILNCALPISLQLP